MAKRPKLIWVFIIILAIIALIQLAGLIIETLFTLNILQTSLAEIRTLGFIPTGLTLLGIASAIVLIVFLLKMNAKSIIIWHILSGIWILSILYKFIEPTYITKIGPEYFLASVPALMIIWLLVFIYLKKKT